LYNLYISYRFQRLNLITFSIWLSFIDHTTLTGPLAVRFWWVLARSVWGTLLFTQHEFTQREWSHHFYWACFIKLNRSSMNIIKLKFNCQSCFDKVLLKRIVNYNSSRKFEIKWVTHLIIRWWLAFLLSI